MKKGIIVVAIIGSAIASSAAPYEKLQINEWEIRGVPVEATGQDLNDLHNGYAKVSYSEFPRYMERDDATVEDMCTGLIWDKQAAPGALVGARVILINNGTNEIVITDANSYDTNSVTLGQFHSIEIYGYSTTYWKTINDFLR